MNNLPDIKNRMKVISDIGKVTGAMETVSIAKMSKALSAFRQNEPYFLRFSSLMGDVVARTKYSMQRYFGQCRGNRAVFLVIGSDKGLVGGFNHDLLKYAGNKIENESVATVLTIGKFASDYFAKQKFHFLGNIDNIESKPSLESAEQIAKRLLMFYDENIADKVYLIYNAYGLAGNMKPSIMQLIPFSADDNNASGYTGELYYESDDEAVLTGLYFSYLTAMIYGCWLQSSVSEHVQRRCAMDTATKNSEELLSELSTEYNRVRQSAVTSELADTARFSE